MNKTKRHTTFRTSVGTKVYVEAPEVYITPGLKEEDLREALREELAFQRFNIVGHSFSFNAFNMYAWVSDPEKETPEDLVNTVKNSLQKKFERWVYVLEPKEWSRELFTLPAAPQQLARWDLALPTMGPKVRLRWGIEGSHIDDFPWIAYFHLDKTKFYAVLMTPSGEIRKDITASLPADYNTSIKKYQIRVFPNKVEYYVGTTVVTTIYSDFVLRSEASAWLMQTSKIGAEPVYFADIRVLQKLDGSSEGYFESGGILWNAQPVTAGTFSDAVPCLGFSQKTIYFIADAAGTLTIQVQEPDGDWQNYDTVSISANTLEVYPMSAMARAVRLSYSVDATVTAWYVFQV